MQSALAASRSLRVLHNSVVRYWCTGSPESSIAVMSTPKIQTLPALTSLRFFAALAIVVHHCNGVFWPAAELGPLDVGVSFFFVLSGFILTYVYRDMPTAPPARGRFYRARIARIWPLHLVCLLLTLILVTLPEPFNPVALGLNLMLLHAWVPFDRIFFSYNYVSWSISTELFFYLMFPLLVTRPVRWTGLAILIALSLVAAFGWAVDQADLTTWDTAGNQLSATGLLYTNPLARLPEFLIGMATGRFFLRPQDAVNPSEIRGSVAEILALAGLFAGYLMLQHGFAPFVHALLLRSGFTDLPLSAGTAEVTLLGQISPFASTLVTEWADHVGLAPLAALVIYVFAQRRGLVSKALSHRWLMFAGEISFALYLLHQLILRALQQHVHQLGSVDFMLYLTAVLLLAALLHLLVEKPARQWLVRRFDSAAAPSASA